MCGNPFTDPRGTQDRCTHDTRGLPTQMVGAYGQAEQTIHGFTYTARGELDVYTDPRGKTSNYDYDQEERVTKVTNHLSAFQVYVWDRAGQLLRFYDELNRRTELEYNPRGQDVSG